VRRRAPSPPWGPPGGAHRRRGTPHPIAEPDDAQYILDHTEGIVGFYGASSMERLPTELAIKAQAQRFKSLTL